MKCRDVRRALPALLDHELPPGETAEVKGHLAHCRACRQILEQYRQDDLLLKQHLRAAPWRPIEHRPWETGQAPTAGFWAALASGGHKLAAGTALVALLAFVTVAALALRGIANTSNGDPTPTVLGSAGEVSTTALDPAATTGVLAGRPTPEVVIEALQEKGLVFDINQEVHAGDQTVRLTRLAVDRTISYLEYTAPAGELDLLVEMLDETGNSLAVTALRTGNADEDGEGTTPLTRNWLPLPGLNPDTQSVMLRLVPRSAAPTDVRVPLDLSPLQALPDTKLVSADSIVNGTRLQMLTLSRGAAVSLLAWEASVVDQSALVAADDADIGPASQAWPVTIEVDGVHVPILSMDGFGRETAWYETAEVFRLPNQGRVRITIDRIYLGSLTGDPAIASAQGPWVLEFDLDGQTTLEPVPTDVVPTPSPPLTPSPQPTATPVPPATPTLPTHLYFAAQADDGVLALWRQPADGSAPRPVVYGPADLEAFWLVPGTNQIAYRLVDNPAVMLTTVDGAAPQPATMPDGRQVAEYVGSPDGKQIAYVTLDRQSLWVGTPGGSKFVSVPTVKDPRTEIITGVEWAPGRDLLRVEIEQAYGGKRSIIVGVGGPNQIVDPMVWELPREALSYAWTPGGSELAYSTTHGIFRFRLTEGGGIETDITPPALRRGGPRALTDLHWLTDGRLAVVAHGDASSPAPADLWLMNPDGSDAWRAVRELGSVADLLWAPGSDGFIVGTIDSEGAEPGIRAMLLWYPSIHDEPVALAERLSSQQFSQLTWSTK